MPNPGHSILLLGPPGSGKSSLARKAAQVEGSAIVALALGMSEETSYRSLRDNPSYVVKGYDDPGFFPTEGERQATGYRQLLADLRAVHKSIQGMKSEDRPKVLITDTISSMGVLAMNETYRKTNKAEAPPAISPDGASFWTYYRSCLESITRVCRSIRGEGLHWIATCHVAEKDIKLDTSLVNVEQAGKIALVPALSGSFRDVLAGEFDLVFFTGVQKDKDNNTHHYLRWKPDNKKPTKSRWGKLADTGLIKNDWRELLARIDAAEVED